MDRNIDDARIIINFHGFGSKVGSWQMEVYDKDVILENKEWGRHVIEYPKASFVFPKPLDAKVHFETAKQRDEFVANLTESFREHRKKG